MSLARAFCRVLPFYGKLAFLLPRGLVYWCVVRAAITVEPDNSPCDVTAEQMLNKLKP